MQNVPLRTSTVPAAPRGRGRPRAFDREAALAAATRLFWRKGYAGTSIADLTAAMGIGSPSLYAAFGSKEALYAEAVGHYAAHDAPRAWAAFAGASSAREAIAALLLDSATAAAAEGDRPPGCMVALSDPGSDNPGPCALVGAARNAALAQVEARLARAVTDGELPARLDVATLARYVLAVLGGLSLQARDGAGRDELVRVARAALAGWDALVAGEGRPGGDGGR